MMATNDAEFALYQKLDKEREDKRRQEYQKLYPERNYDIVVSTSIVVPQSKPRGGKKISRRSKYEEIDELIPGDETQENVDQEQEPEQEQWKTMQTNHLS